MTKLIFFFVIILFEINSTFCGKQSENKKAWWENNKKKIKYDQKQQKIYCCKPSPNKCKGYKHDEIERYANHFISNHAPIQLRNYLRDNKIVIINYVTKLQKSGSDAKNNSKQNFIENLAVMQFSDLQSVDANHTRLHCKSPHHGTFSLSQDSAANHFINHHSDDIPAQHGTICKINEQFKLLFETYKKKFDDDTIQKLTCKRCNKELDKIEILFKHPSICTANYFENCENPVILDEKGNRISLDIQ